MNGPKVRSRKTRLGNKVARYSLATQYPGMSGYCPADEVVRHLRELNAMGLPNRCIASMAGMHEEAVQQLANGKRAVVRTRNAVALLQVTHRPHPLQGRVLAIGAVRRLQALALLGWPLREISERSGVPEKQLWSLANRPVATTTYACWAAVVQAYELLSGTTGPCTRTRERAQKRAWIAALDWEGLDIDDPRVAPERSEPPTLKQVRKARCAELLRQHMTSAQIADQLGITERTVDRYRREIAAETPADVPNDGGQRRTQIAC